MLHLPSIHIYPHKCNKSEFSINDERFICNRSKSSLPRDNHNRPFILSLCSVVITGSTSTKLDIQINYNYRNSCYNKSSRCIYVYCTTRNYWSLFLPFPPPPPFQPLPSPLAKISRSGSCNTAF